MEDNTITWGVAEVSTRVWIPESPRAWQRIINAYNRWQDRECGQGDPDDKVTLRQFLDEPLEDGTRELDASEFALWIIDAYQEVAVGYAMLANEIFPRLGLHEVEFYASTDLIS